jgi:type II secretory pathway pseudopilin PulG
MLRKQGISLIALIITIIVIIILSVVVIGVAVRTPEEAKKAQFISNLTEVKQAVVEKLASNQMQFITNPNSVDVNLGFTRVNILDAPSKFTSFPLESGETGPKVGYVVNLDTIKMENLNMGQGYSSVTDEVQFNIDDTFVYDENGEVYYTNGYNDGGNIIYSLNEVGPETNPETGSKTYGISRDITSSSSAWTRTEGSVGLVANATKDGTPVQNDFDSLYPWSDIISYNYNTTTNQITAYFGDANFKFDGTNGEVLTYIPEFYYKREVVGNIENIYISQSEEDGYTKSEAFSVGRYEMSYSDSKGHSFSGTVPKVSTNITNFRGYAQALGTGFGQIDWRYFAIQTLYLVEYADYDSQSKLGNGATDLGAALSSGGCDSLGMKSGCLNDDSKHSMIYRGIEDIYGNVWEWVDGINIQNDQAYICYNPSNYAINTINGNYSPLGYLNATSNGYATTLGYDVNNPILALPISTGGDTTSYLCDKYFQAADSRILPVGGGYANRADAGLWCFGSDASPWYAGSFNGARLLKY